MAQRMIQPDEIAKIVTIMRCSPIEEGESHNAYYKRIKGTANRSRTTLQLVEQAMKISDDPNVIYQEYARLSKERDTRKKNRDYIKRLYETFGKDPVVIPEDKDDQDHASADVVIQESGTTPEQPKKSILFEETWEPMARLFCWIKKNKVGVTITADGEMMLAAKQETFESLFKRS